MSLLKKAVAAKAAAPKSAKKNTVWLVGDPATNPVAKSVQALVELNGDAKAIAAKMEIHKQVVKEHGHTNYVNGYVANDVAPESPMVIQNDKGSKVTFVMQDRSSQYKIDEERQAMLAELLGADKAQEIMFTDVQFKFSREVMAIPGVAEAIDKALEGAIKKMVAAGTIQLEQGESLLEADVKTAFKPGTLDKLTVICGKDVARVDQFLEIMGSSACEYVKV
jgi:hypothetical protein